MEARLAAGAALVVALLMLGSIAFLYSSIRGIYESLDEISSSIEESRREVAELGEEVSSIRESLGGAATREDLESIRESVEGLRRALEEVRRLRDVDSSKIEALAREIAGLQESLSRLEGSLEAQNDTLRSLIGDLRSELEELEGRIEEVYLSILYPLVIVDGTGSEVVIRERPERIVSMAPSVTEKIYFVNATDRLVGVDDYSDYPAWIAEARSNGTIASIGGFWNPSVEAILGLEPDLVIGVATAPGHIQVKKVLEAQGIPVLLLPSNTIDAVIESIIMVGKAVGNVVEAYRVVEYMRAAESAAEVLFPEAGVRVAVVVWLEPIFVVGGNTWEDELIRLAGGVNVFSDLEGWPVVSPEAFLDRSPEVIILLGHAGVEQSKEDFLSIMRDSLGEDAELIPAIANDRIYVLEGLYRDVYARPSPRTLLSAYVLAAIVNPGALNLSVDDIPEVVSEETLDIVGIVEDLLPDIVAEYVRLVSS